MIITIIGSGNTATVLAKLFTAHHHTIKQVVGRNKKTVEELAASAQASACFSFDNIDLEADVFLIAVKDDAIETVIKQIHIGNKILLHTAGSISIQTLATAAKNYGVLYPLQSLRKELNYTPVIPFLVDGNTDVVKETVFNFARSASDIVLYGDDAIRFKYHTAAIISNNFINHLLALTKDYCDESNIDFQLLLPVINETIIRLENFNPATMQTGPAIRNDEHIIEKHLHQLQRFPLLKNIYALMSESIKSFNTTNPESLMNH